MCRQLIGMECWEQQGLMQGLQNLPKNSKPSSYGFSLYGRMYGRIAIRPYYNKTPIRQNAYTPPTNHLTFLLPQPFCERKQG